MPDARLVCANCGTAPTPLEAKYTAALGKTHWRKLTHAAGVPGREQGGKVRSCGPWIEASATSEQRVAAVRAWREKKGEATR